MNPCMKRVAPVEVPRLGPPVNLRPAGAHIDKRRENRTHQKAALRKAAFDVRGSLERSRANAMTFR